MSGFNMVMDSESCKQKKQDRLIEDVKSNIVSTRCIDVTQKCIMNRGCTAVQLYILYMVDEIIDCLGP